MADVNEDAEEEEELPEHRNPLKSTEVADIRYRSWDNQERIGDLESTTESQRERIEKLEIRVDRLERLVRNEK